MKRYLIILIIIIYNKDGLAQNGCFFKKEDLKDLGTYTLNPGSVDKTTANQIAYATQQEVEFIYQSFLLNSQLYFLNEKDAPNSFATDSKIDHNRPDGTVFFGIKLLSREMERSPGGTSVPIIMAHEYAHLIGFKYKIQYDGKYNELWADYMAGAYMASRNRFFKPTDIDASLKAFFEVGDYDFNSPDHHGTPEERYETIEDGFDDFDELFSNGQGATLKQLIKMAKEYIEDKIEKDK